MYKQKKRDLVFFLQLMQIIRQLDKILIFIILNSEKETSVLINNQYSIKY